MKKYDEKLAMILGQVNFLNCLPINLPLSKINSNVEIINAVPSKLNEMILSSKIDIGPVSSLCYIENKDKLIPIGDLCIASNGPADSVLLFSNKPIEKLHGEKIQLSSASATSNKLLQIILNEFLKLDCEFSSQHSAPGTQDLSQSFLLIGDDALKQSKKNKFVYDLGELWKKYTGLPMVFALWVVRKKVLEKNPMEVKLISQVLNQAKEKGLGEMFNEVIEKANGILPMEKGFYKKYFEHLSFDLNNECKKGLERFEVAVGIAYNNISS